MNKLNLKMDRLKKNKKGFLQEMIILIVIGVVVLVFFAGWKYGFNIINTELINTPSINNATNISDAAMRTTNYINSGLDNLKFIAFAIIFGFMIGTIIIAFYSREHPVLMVIYILSLVMFIILSVFVRNAYINLLENEIIGTTLQGFGLANFIMSNLPIYITIIGFIGIIIMFAGIIKGREFD